jgi:hypothetical protein
MKTLILSTAAALALGAAAVAPASAQSVTIQGPGYSDRGDCRMVEKRVVKDNKTVVTKERRCDGDRRASRDGERYVERRDSGPGIYIGR